MTDYLFRECWNIYTLKKLINRLWNGSCEIIRLNRVNMTVHETASSRGTLKNQGLRQYLRVGHLRIKGKL
jgi:hypothetical protein